MNMFYIPRYKFEYVEWFVTRGMLTRGKANSMKLNNLRGMYVRERRNNG